MSQEKGPSLRSVHLWDARAARLVTLALLLITAACTFQEGSEEAAGDTAEFGIAVGVEPDTLDPAGQTTTTIANIVDYSVETLTEIDKSGKLQPGLAKSWEVSQDGLTVTLNLQEGVTFHDGTPFNADVVKSNLERLLDPKVSVPTRAPYESIETVTAVDDQTVELKLSTPSAFLISALSATTAGMVSPESLNKSGNSYKLITHPVGTGPYTFKSYEKGASVDFEKFDDYWGQKPTYDAVSIKIVPEAATRESMLLAGQVDMIILPPVPDLESLQNNEDVNVLLAPSDRSIFVAMNTEDPMFSDVKVRQAMNYAVDKQALIDNVLFGAADPLDAPMDPELTGYCKTGEYPYDPAKAQSLLKQAGAEEATITMGAPTGRYLQDIQAAEAISGALKEVGVDAKVETMDWASYTSAIVLPPDKAKFNMHLLGWAPQFLDASQQMDQFQSSQHPPDGLATSYYSNPEVDSLIAKADSEPDAAAREKLYCRASELIWKEAPWIFLWSQRFPIVYSSDVEGVSYLPIEKFQAIYARPAE